MRPASHSITMFVMAMPVLVSLGWSRRQVLSLPT
jgi:hypothetical protein